MVPSNNLLLNLPVLDEDLAAGLSAEALLSDSYLNSYDDLVPLDHKKPSYPLLHNNPAPEKKPQPADEITPEQQSILQQALDSFDESGLRLTPLEQQRLDQSIEKYNSNPQFQQTHMHALHQQLSNHHQQQLQYNQFFAPRYSSISSASSAISSPDDLHVSSLNSSTLFVDDASYSTFSSAASSSSPPVPETPENTFYNSLRNDVSAANFAPDVLLAIMTEDQLLQLAQLSRLQAQYGDLSNVLAARGHSNLQQLLQSLPMAPPPPPPSSLLPTPPSIPSNASIEAAVNVATASTYNPPSSFNTFDFEPSPLAPSSLPAQAPTEACPPSPHNVSTDLSPSPLSSRANSVVMFAGTTASSSSPSTTPDSSAPAAAAAAAAAAAMASKPFRKQSESRISLPELYIRMGLGHNHEEARKREQRILGILRAEGFQLGERTWIRDTTEKDRRRIIDEIHRQTFADYAYPKELIEVIVRRGSYYLMQGRLRRIRRGRKVELAQQAKALAGKRGAANTPSISISTSTTATTPIADASTKLLIANNNPTSLVSMDGNMLLGSSTGSSPLDGSGGTPECEEDEEMSPLEAPAGPIASDNTTTLESQFLS